MLPELPKKKKKEKSEVELPPLAVPVEVQITPGAEVTIPLKVYGWRGRNVRFLLRSKPKAGQFQVIEGQNGVWSLRYRHNGTIPPEAGAVDRFYYAAQDPVATSAPAEIVVKIVDFPPKFELPEALGFGELYTGETRKQTLTIANRGGGTVVGRLFADAPWKLSTEAFQLGRGEEKEITVTFAPETEQAYRGRITVAGHPGLDVVLQGAARDAFRVEPKELDLLPAPRGIVRSGTWQLENRSKEERTITITADPRLHLPETVTLPAGETVSLPVRLGEDDLTALSESVTFTNGNLRQTVKVAATAIGARLAAGSLDFGTVIDTQETEKPLTVANRGGSMAQVTVTAPPGVTVEPMRFDLEPGSETVLKVTLRPGGTSEPGNYRNTLRLQTSADVHLDLPIIAVVETAPTANGTRLALPGGGTPDTAPAVPSDTTATPAGTNLKQRLAQLLPRKGDPSVPVVKEVNVRRIGRHSVEITWEAPEGAHNASYQLEARHLHMDAFGQLQVSWQPLKNAVIHRDGTRLSTTLSGPNGSSGQVQVVTISAEGKLSSPSSPISYAAPVRRPIFTTQRLLLTFFLLLGGTAFWLRQRTAGPSSRYPTASEE